MPKSNEHQRDSNIDFQSNESSSEARRLALMELFLLAGSLAEQGLSYPARTLNHAVSDHVKAHPHFWTGLGDSLGNGFADRPAKVTKLFLEIERVIAAEEGGNTIRLFEPNTQLSTRLTLNGQIVFRRIQHEKMESRATGLKDDPAITKGIVLRLRALAPNQLSVDRTPELHQTLNDESEQEGLGSGTVVKGLKQVVKEYREALAEIDEKRKQLAAAFQPQFAALSRALPMNTYEEKKTASDLLNEELRQRGFSLACPRTKRASYLSPSKGDYPEVGRIQLVHYTEGKAIRTFGFTRWPDSDFQVVSAPIAPLALEVQDEVTESQPSHKPRTGGKPR